MIKMNIQFFAADPESIGVELAASGGQLIKDGSALTALTCLYLYGWYVAGNKVYSSAGAVQLTAEPYDGYEFKYWTLNGTQLAENTAQYTDSSDRLTAVFAELPKATYEHILKDGNKVQVDSAIRDGNGNKIDTTYAKLPEEIKYIHQLYISAGGSSGSFEIYTTLYTNSATAITISDLVSTYTLSNKMANINGYLSNASGNNVVYNVFFESTTAAHFNGASLSCTGSTISVTDTVIGRVL